ncbi:hypothetical protein EDC01DRAFT_750302 [Geopyxis carbonaria]|nr:hypothetical protein EDC01DRAFT_750302 [Geopyxis carbonaria]
MMPLNPLNLFVLTLIPLALSLHSPILNEPETNTTTYYHTTAPYKILLGPTYPRVCNVSTTDSPHIEDFELLFQALVKEGNKRHRQYMDDVGPLSNLIDKLVDPDSEAPSDVPDTGVSYGCRVFKQLMYRGIGIEIGLNGA